MDDSGSKTSVGEVNDAPSAILTETDKPAGAKRRFRMPLRIVTVLMILAAMVFWGINMLARPCDRTRTTYADFVVEEGEKTKDVAGKLEEEGIIDDSSRFVLLAKLTLAKSFKPGTYYLSPSMSSFKILTALQSGLTTSKGFTVPPGYTVAQLATALDRDGLADKDKFLEAASSPALAEIDILGEDTEGLEGSDLIEGFLYPSEYTLNSEADESMMIIMMLDAFSNFYNDDYRARADELGITTRQLLVLASMIEKETSVDKEKSAVSGVIHNRINLELTKLDELPEKPLCSPGKESILAALYPDDSEYTYYVLSSRLDGTHRFTSDEEEYNEWLQEYNEAAEARSKDEDGEDQ